MRTVYFAAVETKPRNRPNDLKPVNNLKSRCCTKELSHIGDSSLAHSTQINYLGTHTDASHILDNFWQKLTCFSNFITLFLTIVGYNKWKQKTQLIGMLLRTNKNIF